MFCHVPKHLSNTWLYRTENSDTIITFCKFPDVLKQQRDNIEGFDRNNTNRRSVIRQ